MTTEYDRHHNRMAEMRAAQKHDLIRTALELALSKWSTFTVKDIADFVNGLNEKIK